MKLATLSILLGVGLALAGCATASRGTQQQVSNAPGKRREFAPRSVPTPLLGAPRNVILFLGDGMGTESVKAASLFASGTEGGGLTFQAFPNQASMTHHSANNSVTDSAAAATAIATGVKVDNSVISVRQPGDGAPLGTLLEFYKAHGKSVGLLTTTYVEDATPAAFAAHQSGRGRLSEIADDYLEYSRPDLVMGGFTYGAFDPEAAKGGGYQVASSRDAMQAVTSVAGKPLAGLFGEGPLASELDGDFSTVPRLSEMTSKALTLLDNDPQGFFLLVENENIDEWSHHNDIERTVAGTLELSNSVRVAMEWAGKREDTLFLVTADHETGGLKVVASQGQGKMPQVTWSTRGHTDAPVPVYAQGPLGEGFRGKLDNTDIVRLLTGHPEIDI